MAVNITKLWSKVGFLSLSKEAKLFYVYLITAPDLNTLGLLYTTTDKVDVDLGFDVQELRSVTLELLEDYISVFSDKKDRVWFFIKDHFNSLPRSEAVAKRCKKDIEKVPEEILDELAVNGLLPNLDFAKDWKAPTKREVEEYALSQGYIIDGKEVCEFYEEEAERLGKSGWYDSRGKQVRDWRAMLRKVWFRKAEKLKPGQDAPEGFEYFYVFDEHGKKHFASHWVNGKPLSKEGMVVDLVLQKKFNEKQD